MSDQYFHKIKLRFADGHAETLEGIFLASFEFTKVNIYRFSSEKWDNCIVERKSYSFPGDIIAFVIS